MTDSKQWALEQLEKANHIFEVDEKSLVTQMIDFLIYVVEIGVCWFIVSHFFR